MVKPAIYNDKLAKFMGRIIKPIVIQLHEKTDDELISDFKTLNQLSGK